MSRVIQWGVRHPEPENKDEVDVVTKTCVLCENKFDVRKSTRSYHAIRYCPTCKATYTGSNLYAQKNRPKTFEFDCVICHKHIVLKKQPNIRMGGFRVKCDSCKKLEAVGGGSYHFVSAEKQPLAFVNSDVAKKSTLAEVGDTSRIDELLSVEYEQDLEYISTCAQRDGFLWGKSATNGPHDRDLLVRSVKEPLKTPRGFFASIGYAKPAPVKLDGLTLNQAIEKVRNYTFPRWGGVKLSKDKEKHAAMPPVGTASQRSASPLPRSWP